MQPETKTCQNCKQNFQIEPEDFLFYEKMKVPPPTWCPECRLKRRMVWRNERNLYRVKDAVSGQEVFSGIPQQEYTKSNKFRLFRSGGRSQELLSLLQQRKSGGFRLHIKRKSSKGLV